MKNPTLFQISEIKISYWPGKNKRFKPGLLLQTKKLSWRYFETILLSSTITRYYYTEGPQMNVVDFQVAESKIIS